MPKIKNGIDRFGSIKNEQIIKNNVLIAMSDSLITHADATNFFVNSFLLVFSIH